jgi:transposase-like protein
MKRSPVLGPTIQSKPDVCPACDGRRIIKRGLRKNSFRQLQIYWCKDCGRYFLSLAGLKGVKYPPRVIARVLCLYNLGHSQEEAARRIASEHRITVPRRTISNWISGYRSITTFHRLRAAAILQFGDSMLKERTLEHQQAYQYRVHLPKLERMVDAVPADVAAKVKRYLLSVFEDFPDFLFQEDSRASLDQQAGPDGRRPELAVGLRSSKSRFEMLPLFRTEKQNLANDLAALGLLLARKNKDRHPSVQDFMLANDSCTLACEVPVYLTAEEIGYYKSKGFFVTLPESPKPITGHIDVVQTRNGLIHLLDYKPKARHIDPVNQLVVYALAFASRTRLPVKVLKCAWFDEKDYFEFFPLQAIKAKSRCHSEEAVGWSGSLEASGSPSIPSPVVFELPQ